MEEEGGLAWLQALPPGKKPQGIPRDCARQGLGVPLGSVWQPHLVFAHQLLLSESAPGFLLPQGHGKPPHPREWGRLVGQVATRLGKGSCALLEGHQQFMFLFQQP